MKTDYGVAQLFVETDGRPVIKFRYFDGKRFDWTSDCEDKRIWFTHQIEDVISFIKLNDKRYIVYRKSNGKFIDISIKIMFSTIY